MVQALGSAGHQDPNQGVVSLQLTMAVHMVSQRVGKHKDVLRGTPFQMSSCHQKSLFVTFGQGSNYFSRLDFWIRRGQKLGISQESHQGLRVSRSMSLCQEAPRLARTATRMTTSLWGKDGRLLNASVSLQF